MHSAASFGGGLFSAPGSGLGGSLLLRFLLTLIPELLQKLQSLLRGLALLLQKPQSLLLGLTLPLLGGQRILLGFALLLLFGEPEVLALLIVREIELPAVIGHQKEAAKGR